MHNEFTSNKTIITKLEQLMQQGKFVDKSSNIEYFTGYSYKTLYDWDQYFESLVQIHMNWNNKYIVNGIKVFLNAQHDNGFIPRLNQPTGTPDNTEHAKPFFAQMLLILLKKNENIDDFSNADLIKIENYINYWINVQDRNLNGLPSWQSAPHSGMDNQHERAGYWNDCFCEGVDLASFLYREIIAFSLIQRHKHNVKKEEEFIKKAEVIKNAMQKYMWNNDDNFFYDVNEKTNQQIKCLSIAGFAPLWAGIASKEQAELIIKNHLLNKNEFWRNFPVSALSATENGYSETLLKDDLGCNWRANTWIPTNYYIMHGLLNYGYYDEALSLAKKTHDVLLAQGEREYYNSDSATGCGLNPFWGWSILGYFMPFEVTNKIDFTALDLSTIKDEMTFVTHKKNMEN